MCIIFGQRWHSGDYSRLCGTGFPSSLLATSATVVSSYYYSSSFSVVSFAAVVSSFSMATSAATVSSYSSSSASTLWRLRCYLWLRLWFLVWRIQFQERKQIMILVRLMWRTRSQVNRAEWPVWRWFFQELRPLKPTSTIVKIAKRNSTCSTNSGVPFTRTMIPMMCLRVLENFCYRISNDNLLTLMGFIDPL